MGSSKRARETQMAPAEGSFVRVLRNATLPNALACQEISPIVVGFSQREREVDDWKPGSQLGAEPTGEQ